MQLSPMIHNPTLHTEGQGFFLPLPITSWSETDEMRTVVEVVAGADGELPLSQRRGGISIQVSGRIVGFTSYAEDLQGTPYSLASSITAEFAKRFRDALRAACRGQFSLYRFDDRRWDGCFLESAPFVWTNRTDAVIEYSLSIRCTNPDENTSEGIAQTGTNPYGFLIQRYSSGGAEPMTYRNDLQPTYTFLGLAAATTPGKEIIIPTPGPATATWRVARLLILSVTGAVGTGDTTVVLSTTPIGVAGGQSMSVTIDEGDTTGEETDGFDVAGLSNLYLYLSAGGVHADVQVLIQYGAA